MRLPFRRTLWRPGKPRLAAPGLILLAVVAALWPVAAHGHASLVRADPAGVTLPAPPRLVSAWFSEPVTPVGQGMLVYAPSGRMVSRGRAEVSGATLSVGVDADEEGTYLVEWRVLAQDSHPSRGSFTFDVRRATRPPAGSLGTGSDVAGVTLPGLALQLLGRWLHFGGLALLVGPAVLSLLTRPVGAAGTPARRPSAGIVTTGIAALLLAEAVLFLAEIASLGSFDANTTSAVLGSGFGRLLALRLAAGLLAWGAVDQILNWRQGAWLLLGFGAVIAALDGFSGHTATVSRAVIVPVEGLHTLAMAVWVGGFAALAAEAATTRRGPEPKLLARFGRLMAIALTLSAVTGVVLALIHLRRAPDLLGHPYGVAIIVKSLLVAAALAAGWYGLRRRRAAWPEAALLAAVLALASILISQAPPR